MNPRNQTISAQQIMAMGADAARKMQEHAHKPLMNPEAPKCSEIESLLSYSEAQAHQLHSIVSELIRRLEKVLTPSPQASSEAVFGGPRDIATTGLSAQICQIHDIHEVTLRSVSETLDRLAL